MIYKRLSFLGMIIFSIFSITAAQNTTDPFANMSDEEFAQMLNYIDTVAKQFEEEYKKLTPEQQAQVDRELREELIRNGIDPDTLQPLNQPAPQLPQQPTTPATPPQTPPPAPPVADQPSCPPTQKYTQQQASCLLQKIISLIESCRRKLSLMPLKELPLNHWLSVLAFYTKTISSNNHVQRLTLITYERLFQLLTKLESTLNTYEPQLTVLPQDDDADHNDASLDPYRILGVSPRASDEDVTASYQALCAAYDIQKIEQNLKEQKLNPQRIKRQLDAIKLQLRNIEDAYEQLHDAKLRAQIDRNAILIYQQRHAVEEEAQRTYLEFQNALHQLILNGLFEAFDQFFAQFEPIAITHRKEMDTAEQQRRAEQDARHKLVATPSNNIRGGEYPDWYSTSEPQNYYSPTPPPTYTPSTATGSGQSGPTGGSEIDKKGDGASKQKSGGGGAKSPSNEQAKKDKDKDDAQKKGAAKKDDEKKTPQQLFTDLNKGVAELDKVMQEVTKILAEEENKKMIADVSSTTFEKLADQQKHDLATLLQKVNGKNDKLTTTLNKIRTAAEELTKNPNQQAAVTKAWTAHKTPHNDAYTALARLHRPLKKFVAAHPETTIAPIFTKFVESMKEIEQLDKIAKIQPLGEEENKKNTAKKQQKKNPTKEQPPQQGADREDKEEKEYKSKQQVEEDAIWNDEEFSKIAENLR